MANVRDIKRIVKEDFAADDQAVADKLAYSLNPFMESVVDAFDGNIDMTNLNMQIVTIQNFECVSNVPVRNSEFNYATSGFSGAFVLYVQNTTNRSSYVNAAPGIVTNVKKQGIAEIVRGFGFIDNNKYTIKLLVVGS